MIDLGIRHNKLVSKLKLFWPKLIQSFDIPSATRSRFCSNGPPAAAAEAAAIAIVPDAISSCPRLCVSIVGNDPFTPALPPDLSDCIHPSPSAHRRRQQHRRSSSSIRQQRSAASVCPASVPWFVMPLVRPWSIPGWRTHQKPPGSARPRQRPDLSAPTQTLATLASPSGICIGVRLPGKQSAGPQNHSPRQNGSRHLHRPSASAVRPWSVAPTQTLLPAPIRSPRLVSIRSASADLKTRLLGCTRLPRSDSVVIGNPSPARSPASERQHPLSLASTSSIIVVENPLAAAFVRSV